MKYSRPAMTAQLQLSQVPVRSEVEIVVTGVLLDGTPFEARDCIKIVH